MVVERLLRGTALWGPIDAVIVESEPMQHNCLYLYR